MALEILIRSVQISDIAVKRLVIQEEPSLSPIKSQLKGKILMTHMPKANSEWRVVLNKKNNNTKNKIKGAFMAFFQY